MVFVNLKIHMVAIAASTQLKEINVLSPSVEEIPVEYVLFQQLRRIIKRRFAYSETALVFLLLYR